MKRILIILSLVFFLLSLGNAQLRVDSLKADQKIIIKGEDVTNFFDGLNSSNKLQLSGLAPDAKADRYPFQKYASCLSIDDVRNSIIKIELFNTDPTKRYFLKTFGKDYAATSNRSYFVIEEEGHSASYGVSKFVTDNYSEPSGIDKIYLEPNGTDMYGYAWIDWDETTSNVRYTYTTYDQAGFSEEIKMNTPYGFIRFSEDYTFWKYEGGISPKPFIKNATFEDSPVGECIMDIKITGKRDRDYYISWFGRNYYFDAGHQHRYYIFIGDKDTPLLCGYNVDDLNEGSDGITEHWIEENDTKLYIKIDWDYFPDGERFITSSYEKTGISNDYIEYTMELDSLNRLILPDTLFLVDYEKLPVYRSSLISADTTVKQSDCYIVNNNSDVPITTYFSENYFINPDDYNDLDSIEIGQFLPEVYDKYYKDVHLRIADTIGISGKDATFLMIGNSITDYSIADLLGNRLAAINATGIDFIGTRADGGFANEGRASWEYRTLVGMQTERGNQAEAVYPEPTVGNAEFLTWNPFLDEATAGEISAHPEWVFENHPNLDDSYLDKEENYTESVASGSYAGNYYTFDFDNYISSYSITVPSGDPFVVLCNLGFNDLNHHSETDSSMDEALLAIEIMCNRIYEYRNNTIIGLSPVLVVNEQNYWDKYSTFIERVDTLVTGMREDGIKVEIVGLWVSVDRKLAYDYDTISDLSTENDSKIAAPTDEIHPGNVGKKQITNAIMYWLINKIR